MRRKKITVLCLSLIFAAILGTQVVSTANAETENGQPLTSPITYFTISGNVTYQFFKFLWFGKKDAPAAGVTVTAVDKFHHVKYQTQTDNSGNYTITTQVGGQFFVSPSDGKTNNYVPPINVVEANHPGQKTNVDFKGLVF